MTFPAMESAEWQRLLRESPAPERVESYARGLAAAAGRSFPGDLSPELAKILAALFSGSRSMSELLIQRPQWFSVLDPEGLTRPRQLSGLWREVNLWLTPALEKEEYSTALSNVRDFKQKEMLRIAGRDLARLGNVSQITEEIANVADVCVEAVRKILWQQLTGKFGIPYTQELTGEWEPATYCVLGMGKLGGQELNYSSDIDVLFVYSGEGDVYKSPPGKKPAGPKSLTNHQFFNRLSEGIIAEITRLTDQRALFRIDLRLRPEGKSGPLSRSLASYETYYFQWGQTWERMMLIKARCIAGDQVLGAEFMDIVQPFRYPRTISEQLPREVAAMKQRIETEVIRSGELERNVKLGRGGIREIEFVAQTLQVLHGGRLPFLQTSKTLTALEKISDYHLMERADTDRLKDAYCFLRDLEHRIQMEDERQTHTIPTSKDSQERLAKLMGFENGRAFEKALREHNDFVRFVYERQMKGVGQPENQKMRADFVENPENWREILQEHGFREPDRGVHLIRQFVLGPGFGHTSGRTTELAMQLIHTFLSRCRKKGAPPPEGQWLSDPDRVVARLDSFVAGYGARALLYETWTSNNSLFELLLLLFDRSEYLAELAIREPDLVEQIEQSGQLRRRKSKEQIMEDLCGGITEKDQHSWLRRYFRAEQMRLGLRDILGLADADQIESELTALAEAFLSYGLKVMMRKHNVRKPPFAIFGLGKLGGSELIYASDLDIIFVAPTAAKNLPKFQKIAIELMDLLSARTEQGTTFATDARLRPDGEKGMLVNTVKAYADYYQKRAMLWEVQSYSRMRPIAGDEKVIGEMEKLVPRFTDFSKPNKEIAAFTPGWKQEIHRMRMRIEKERTSAGKDELAIKTGKGGLMDAEFVAQALCLENGWREPNTLRALKLAAKVKALGEQSASRLIESYFKLMEYERILRRWSFEPESVLPDTPPPMYRVAVRCGFESIDEFLAATGKLRAQMRRGYLDYFEATD